MELHIFKKLLPLNIWDCDTVKRTKLIAIRHAFQSLKAISYKHKELIQRNKKNLLHIKVQSQKTLFFFFLEWVVWVLWWRWLFFTSHKWCYANECNTFWCWKPQYFDFSWQLLVTELRSFSFLPESISASRNMPVPTLEKCSLTFCYFYMDKTTCMLPNCRKKSRHFWNTIYISCMHGEGWRRDCGNCSDLGCVIILSKNENAKCSWCMTYILYVWYTLHAHVRRKCLFL